MKIGVKVMPRKEILDTQGRAVEGILKQHGQKLEHCTVGKYIILDIPETDAKAAGAVTMNWGVFTANVLAFLIDAAVVFLALRAAQNMSRKPAPAAPDTKLCPFCATVIPLAAKRCPNCTSEL